jgi:hypothetical protein
MVNAPSPRNVTPPAPMPAPRQPAPARRTTRRWTMALAGVTTLILAALALARYASAPVEDAATTEPPDRLERAADAGAPGSDQAPASPALESVPVASAGMVVAPVVTERPKAPAVNTVKPRPKKTAMATSAKSRVAAPVKSTAPSAATAVASVPVRGDGATIGQPAPFAPTVSAGLAPVTLTGCLEVSVNRDEFRLSDIDGIDAPKARSWRTAFLMKRSTPVALVEPPDPRGLQIQVGKRVEATGVLTDRELKVSSVRIVGPACN